MLNNTVHLIQPNNKKCNSVKISMYISKKKYRYLFNNYIETWIHFQNNFSKLINCRFKIIYMKCKD